MFCKFSVSMGATHFDAKVGSGGGLTCTYIYISLSLSLLFEQVKLLEKA